MHKSSTTISLARGDGIGPEIMEAVLNILDAADAGLICEEIQIGESAYLAGHIADIASERTVEKVGTSEFATAVIQRLGHKPKILPAMDVGAAPAQIPLEADSVKAGPAPVKELKGIDIFLDGRGQARDPRMLGPALTDAVAYPLQLKMITNRGVKVYPDGFPETFCTDHWRCRFVGTDRDPAPRDLIELQIGLIQRGFDIFLLIRALRAPYFSGEFTDITQNRTDVVTN
jgi:isocitrate dehydrogenase